MTDHTTHEHDATTHEPPPVADATADATADASVDVAADATADVAADATADPTDDAPAGDPTPDEPEITYSVDELAAAAGLPVRTVRHYQSEKVLPPPERHGRTARYRPEHLERLHLIARLQDRGLQLSAIRDVFKRVEKGELWLDDWLGLGEALRAPWSQQRPIVLSDTELAERVGDRPGTLAALEQAGLVRRQHGLSGPFLVPAPDLLDIAVQLDAAGVDLSTAADAAAIMRTHLRRAGTELVEHFLSRAGAGFGRQGSADDYAEALAALRPLGARAVQVIFVQEIERSLRHAVEQGYPTPPTPRSSGTNR